MVAIAAKADGQALVGGRRDRRVPDTGASSLPAATIGLGVFLAVVSSLFALFISAYFMRMQVADWTPLPAPKLLWLNTGRADLEQCRAAMGAGCGTPGKMDGVGAGLIAGGALRLASWPGSSWRGGSWTPRAIS